MSVIVWDGQTLAADRMTTSGDSKSECQKLVRYGDLVVAWCGRRDVALQKIEWVRFHDEGVAYPPFAEADEADLVVWRRGRPPEAYYGTPLPVEFPQSFAWGSGKDVALGALYAGANAVQAVMAANAINAFCGFGVDSFSDEGWYL